MDKRLRGMASALFRDYFDTVLLPGIERFLPELVADRIGAFALFISLAWSARIARHFLDKDRPQLLFVRARDMKRNLRARLEPSEAQAIFRYIGSILLLVSGANRW
jgi:hypothetical protein